LKNTVKGTANSTFVIFSRAAVVSDTQPTTTETTGQPAIPSGQATPSNLTSAAIQPAAVISTSVPACAVAVNPNPAPNQAGLSTAWPLTYSDNEHLQQQLRQGHRHTDSSRTV